MRGVKIRKIWFLFIFIGLITLISNPTKADVSNSCCSATNLQIGYYGYDHIYPSGDIDFWYTPTEKRWVSLGNYPTGEGAIRDFKVDIYKDCISCNPSNYVQTCNFYSTDLTSCSFPADDDIYYLKVYGNPNSIIPYVMKLQYKCAENQCYSEYWNQTCYWDGDLCCEGDTTPGQWYCQYLDNNWKGCTNDNHNICEQSDNAQYICQKGYYEGDWRWRDCSSCYGDCKYPDLTISESWLDPPQASIDPDVDTKIYFKIKNLNDVDTQHSYINIGYYLDGVFQTALPIGYLEAFEEGTFWVPDKIGCGDHTIELVADYDKRITESNENNNGAALVFTVNCKDLTVTEVHVNPNPPYAEQSTDIGFKIKNIGNAKITENFYSKVYIHGLEKTNIYETLDINPDYGINYNNPLAITLGCGSHTVMAKTDTSSSVMESNEGNNERSETYYWSCPSGKTCINGECCECTSGLCCDGCHYRPSGYDCGICKSCNGAGSCSVTPSDDSDCGVISCDDWHHITGSPSPTGTNYCYDSPDITSNRCEAFGDCKDSNTADCGTSDDILELSCGICRYVSGCSGETDGYCTNYAQGTSCGTNKGCNGNGSCVNIQCGGTDTACGIYPNCINCNNNDSCYGNYYKNYYCINNNAGCSYTSDNCADCSCSCGGYNAAETKANGNANDGKDNDCDGLIDEYIFYVSLNKSWNLVSIPLVLINNSVAGVFSGIGYSKIFYYYSGWKVPTKVNITLGYWVKLNNSAALAVEGFPPNNTLINLNKGWNLIGYPYLNETETNSSNLKNYTTFTYINNSWIAYTKNRTDSLNSLKKLKPGYGYWVKK